MSLYIPGLNLPRANQELWIAIQSDGSLRYNSCGWHDSQQKATAVQSHGRLGDLDALIAMLERQINNHEKQAKMADTKGTGYTNDMYICDRNRDIIPILKTAPTIIPAEPSEEQREYESAVEYAQYCEIYEPSYDPETGAL